MNSTITMNAVNPAVPGTPPTIYVGVTTVLNVTLGNNTGGDIVLTPGATPSQLKIYLPYYFTNTEVAAMQVNNISDSGWQASHDDTDGILLLTWNGNKGLWTQGNQLSFTITNAKTSSAPGS